MNRRNNNVHRSTEDPWISWAKISLPALSAILFVGYMCSGYYAKEDGSALTIKNSPLPLPLPLLICYNGTKSFECNVSPEISETEIMTNIDDWKKSNGSLSLPDPIYEVNKTVRVTEPVIVQSCNIENRMKKPFTDVHNDYYLEVNNYAPAKFRGYLKGKIKQITKIKQPAQYKNIARIFNIGENEIKDIRDPRYGHIGYNIKVRTSKKCPTCQNRVTRYNKMFNVE